jgi:hypothetical protein
MPSGGQVPAALPAGHRMLVVRVYRSVNRVCRTRLET